MARDSFGLKEMSSESLKARFKNGDLEAVTDVSKNGSQEVRNTKTGKTYTVRVKSPTRNIVTSENREEFMAKKLGLAKKEKPVYDEQDPPIEKYSVKYHNEKGEEEGEKEFENEEKAKAYMEKGNRINKVGGKYSMSKVMVK